MHTGHGHSHENNHGGHAHHAGCSHGHGGQH